MPSPSLFWRTLLLVLALIVASLGAWLQSFRVLERAPRAQSTAQQVVSVVNVTRAALLYSDPFVRRDLLAELAANEGIRIYPLESSDVVTALPQQPLIRLIEKDIVERLGAGTRVAAEVNGVAGIWVSLSIDDDRYWVYINRDPVARTFGTQWLGWAAVALLLSVLGAILITRLINRPLAKLSAAAALLGRGQSPPLLPAAGPAEIRTVNESFNRMVADLGKLDADRAVLLAGISHDLRTPMTRLRLELELAGLPETTRAAMGEDLAQMDAIVRQFLDYARSAPRQNTEDIELASLIEAGLRRTRLNTAPRAHIQLELARGIHVQGHRTELERALQNIFTNAERYGRDPLNGELNLTVTLSSESGTAVISVSDRGPGVPADAVERLLRPFERGDEARSGSSGAGLGLAIVQRIAQMHGGRLGLKPADPQGLCIELTLPLAARS